MIRPRLYFVSVCTGRSAWPWSSDCRNSSCTARQKASLGRYAASRSAQFGGMANPEGPPVSGPSDTARLRISC